MVTSLLSKEVEQEPIHEIVASHALSQRAAAAPAPPSDQREQRQRSTDAVSNARGERSARRVVVWSDPQSTPETYERDQRVTTKKARGATAAPE